MMKTSPKFTTRNMLNRVG